jgi:hypothetical protein
MDSPHPSVGKFLYNICLCIIYLINLVGRENVLEQALRTYEESERSLKSICNSFEQENAELETELKILQNAHLTLLKEYHLLKERLHQIRGEHARLAERQLFIDQQTKQIHQRFNLSSFYFAFYYIKSSLFSHEQVENALKKILSCAISTHEDLSQETFSLLGLKIIPIDEERRVTNDIGTIYDPPCLAIKRKLNSNDQRESKSSESKHIRSHSSSSSSHRSSM